MSKPRTHRARALTVAVGIVACILASAAYTAPEDGEPLADPAAVASEDAPVAGQDDAAPTAEREFEHEYEPEPQPAETPAAVQADADPAPAPSPVRDVEHEYEPEPTPPAPAPAPAPDAPHPAAPTPPPPPPAAEAPTPPAAAERPVAVAGSPAPHPGPPPPADGAPAEPDDPDVAGAGESERTPSSARATAPSGSMTALRSSTMDSFDDEVLAPLVAPREVARADTPARRVTVVTPADRELLASGGSPVTAPAAFAGSTGAPSPTVILTSVLLTLAGGCAGAYAFQRRGARGRHASRRRP